ncbi:MAG: exosortase-associated EpsI family protein, partial [Verrucomicrobiae bacterium]|nr:exosortase-associated EpsI family protein [Verrucomicrobiae bacterium]
CVVVVVMILTTMFVLGKTVTVHQEPVAGVKMELPDRILNYSGVEGSVSPLEIETLGKDTEFERKVYYSLDGKTTFWLSIVLSGKDRTSIHPPEACLRGQGWDLESHTEVLFIPMSRPHPYRLPVRKLAATESDDLARGRSKRQLLYLYWFVGKDLVTPTKNTMTFRESWDRVFYGKSHRWAYVTLAAVMQPGQDQQTLQKMEAFLQAAVPEFQLVAPQES